MLSSTEHSILYQDARNELPLTDETVDLIITSPPYPMIKMWDELYGTLHSHLTEEIIEEESLRAFDIMHNELLKVWQHCFRVLKPGGFMCINVGDTTRSFNGTFHLFSNHSRIIEHCISCGFHALPHILWRKSTNSPAKFMGSGTLPAGAYVTLEHEYILIFRKGERRLFSGENDKQLRRESSFFWEERNIWFSDLWEMQGKRQKLTTANEELRFRSAAFPFEIPYRLIQMFSLQGDMIFDPFMGTGTTALAAMTSGRNSLGIELDPLFKEEFLSSSNQIKEIINQMNDYIDARIENHLTYMKSYIEKKGNTKHFNTSLNCRVITRSEAHLALYRVNNIQADDRHIFKVEYEKIQR